MLKEKQHQQLVKATATTDDNCNCCGKCWTTMCLTYWRRLLTTDYERAYMHIDKCVAVFVLWQLLCP